MNPGTEDMNVPGPCGKTALAPRANEQSEKKGESPEAERGRAWRISPSAFLIGFSMKPSHWQFLFSLCCLSLPFGFSGGNFWR